MNHIPELLPVRMNYYSDAIISETLSGDPIYGDIVMIVIGDHVFRQSCMINRSTSYKDRIYKLGQSLQNLGTDICKHAAHGKLTWRKSDGKKEDKKEDKD